MEGSNLLYAYKKKNVAKCRNLNNNKKVLFKTVTETFCNKSKYR